jgi:hypothetical protein
LGAEIPPYLPTISGALESALFSAKIKWRFVMSRHQDQFILNLPLDESLAACRSAANGPGWRLTREADTALACMEIPQPGLGFTSPAQVDIGLTSTDDNATRVTLRGSNFGLGPIQSNHVRKQVQLLRQQIEHAGAPAREPNAPATYSRSVVVNGERVSDEELAQLEQKGVRVSDGRYWYDRACGAWGLEGGPTVGFILPGLSVRGPLRADASNGNTGVFINGRQLHLQDVAGLRSLAGTVLPGRWWVDAQGNFGMEGGGLMGNLWLLAQMRRTTVGSGSSHISSSGVTVGGEGGFVYAQGRDALGNPFSVYSG